MFSDRPEIPISRIADSVLRLSDFYIAHPSSATPWNEEYCQLAYRYYYLPLNKHRCSQVMARGEQVGFFKDLNHFIDWGCGPGTASLALAESQTIRTQIQSQLLFDHSTTALKSFADLHTQLVKPVVTDRLRLGSASNKQKSLLIFSYSMTELDQLPDGWDLFEALMILEPSTRDDGRKLLEWRRKIIEAGFYIWAPCTHQDTCPLLNHSKNDWCHDRFHVNAPDWFSELEQYMPIRNRTITTSYLLARKTPPPKSLQSLSRITGDSLEEKGKTRQLVCRNERREFLSWMHKSTTPQTIERGALVRIPENIELKSNEMRLTLPVEEITGLVEESPTRLSF